VSFDTVCIRMTQAYKNNADLIYHTIRIDLIKKQLCGRMNVIYIFLQVIDGREITSIYGRKKRPTIMSDGNTLGIVFNVGQNQLACCDHIGFKATYTFVSGNHCSCLQHHFDNSSSTTLVLQLYFYNSWSTTLVLQLYFYNSISTTLVLPL